MSKTICNGCDKEIDETEPYSIKHGYTYCLECSEALKEIERQEVNDLYGGSMEQ